MIREPHKGRSTQKQNEGGEQDINQTERLQNSTHRLHKINSKQITFVYKLKQIKTDRIVNIPCHQ